MDDSNIIEGRNERVKNTPFGNPSDVLIEGKIGELLKNLWDIILKIDKDERRTTDKAIKWNLCFSSMFLAVISSISLNLDVSLIYCIHE